MINRLSVRNFKSLESVNIELARFTVFVGANGSGKSSILQALHLLCECFRQMRHSTTPFVNGKTPNSELSKSATRSSTESVVIEVQAENSGYRVIEEPNFDRDGPVPQPILGNSGITVSVDIDSDNWQPVKMAKSIKPLPTSVLLRLDPSKLMQSDRNGDAVGFYNPDQGMSAEGRGMHAALADMALNDPDAWHNLQEELSEIVPSIHRLRHTRAMPNKSPELLFDTKFGARSLTASEVSEGTLLVVGLLTALHSPDLPNLILLDDLDKGLHPKAQRELILLLRRFLAQNPDLQILASTHSPYLLDCMEADEVRITYLEKGKTICAPLTRHPKFQTWKDEMHSGELWSLFGEEWVVENQMSDHTDVTEGAKA